MGRITRAAQEIIEFVAEAQRSEADEDEDGAFDTDAVTEAA